MDVGMMEKIPATNWKFLPGHTHTRAHAHAHTHTHIYIYIFIYLFTSETRAGSNLGAEEPRKHGVITTAPRCKLTCIPTLSIQLTTWLWSKVPLIFDCDMFVSQNGLHYPNCGPLFPFVRWHGWVPGLWDVCFLYYTAIWTHYPGLLLRIAFKLPYNRRHLLYIRIFTFLV
jgi:hypothetical protein